MIDEKETMVLTVSDEEAAEQIKAVMSSDMDEIYRIQELERIPHYKAATLAARLKRELINIKYNSKDIRFSCDYLDYKAVVYPLLDDKWQVVLFDVVTGSLKLNKVVRQSKKGIVNKMTDKFWIMIERFYNN